MACVMTSAFICVYQRSKENSGTMAKTLNGYLIGIGLSVHDGRGLAHFFRRDEVHSLVLRASISS